MPAFAYTARDRQGERRQGSLDAKDRREAVAALQRKGLTPISLTEGAADTRARPEKKTAAPAKPPVKPAAPTRKKAKAKPAAISKRASGKLRLSLREVLQFSCDLRDLLNAGMTLGTALQKLKTQGDNPARKQILTTIHESIVQGGSLSDALRQQPRSFPEFYVSIIHAGEAGGQLQQALNNVVIHYERVQAARDQVVGTLMYPAIVGILMGLTLIGCLVFIVPRFAEIFEDIGQTLPLPTRILMSLSQNFLKYGVAFVGVGLLAIYGFRSWMRTPAGRLSWHGFLLRIPVAHRVIRSAAFSNFARTLANLLENGVPVLKALKIVENTVGNAVLAREVASARERVTDGASLSKPLAESGVFPALFTDMLSVGEEAGEVPRSLQQIAARYDSELERSLKVFATVLEPLLMVVIASMVAFVAISMLLPVFQMTQGFGR